MGESPLWTDLVGSAQCHSPLHAQHCNQQSPHRVEELSNQDDLTINLTFKIPSEQVWSTLIYFTLQTIRFVLKPWLTRSNYLLPYVSNVPRPNMKTGGESHPLLKSKGGMLAVELGFHPANHTNSVWVLPMSEGMWIFLWCPSYYVKVISQATLISSSKNRRFYLKKTYSGGTNYVLGYNKMLCYRVW